MSIFLGTGSLSVIPKYEVIKKEVEQHITFVHNGQKNNPEEATFNSIIFYNFELMILISIPTKHKALIFTFTLQRIHNSEQNNNFNPFLIFYEMNIISVNFHPEQDMNETLYKKYIYM